MERDQLVRENLKALRIASGKTTKELEEFIGMGRGSWSRFETGKASPSIRRLALISNKMKVNFNQLLSMKAKLRITWEETQVWQDPEKTI